MENIKTEILVLIGLYANLGIRKKVMLNLKLRQIQRLETELLQIDIDSMEGTKTYFIINPALAKNIEFQNMKIMSLEDYLLPNLRKLSKKRLDTLITKQIKEIFREVNYQKKPTLKNFRVLQVKRLFEVGFSINELERVLYLNEVVRERIINGH